jgi:hypothetical protein
MTPVCPPQYQPLPCTQLPRPGLQRQHRPLPLRRHRPLRAEGQGRHLPRPGAARRGAAPAHGGELPGRRSAGHAAVPAAGREGATAAAAAGAGADDALRWW